jgi:glutamine amidotransferase
MTEADVIVVDYGLGNLFSVRRALEYCGAVVDVTSDVETIRLANRVILPGVGSFGYGMAELRRHGFDEVLREIAFRGTPLFCICLGMQMLLDESEEFGLTSGLGLIPGRVVPIPPLTADGKPQRVPHIGWNSLAMPLSRTTWSGTPLSGLNPGDAVYFVHSFMARPDDPEHRIADCLYGEVPVTAAIGNGNVFGCQFHPEKSGEIGLSMLRWFLRQ